MRTVTGYGWPYEYRAYIFRYDGWFRHGWKYVIERKWVHWSHHRTSRVFKTETEAEAAANLALDAYEDNWHDRSYVGEGRS